MSLSADLVSQFAKATVTKQQTPSESTVQGTAVIYDGKTYVKFDGSDLLTPVNTTSSVNDGDRVNVTVKNHTATITGNMSDPSASSGVVTEQGVKVEEMGTQISEFEIIVADKVSVDELDAVYATIDTLVADDVVIKGELEANKADIKDLQAENVTITEQLTATNATIENLETTKLDVSIADITYATIEDLETTNATIYNLEATYGDFKVLTTDKLTAIEGDIKNLDVEKLDAETASITYATISDLEATNAKITKLDADVANIDTLIFGSASGDTIQSEFSNAVVAQIDDAQIKSAMIESLSASKITAGDIITNNVRVMSDDGKLLIADETIQISDSNRVRVQIGKDATGDYSISIWDADGNLMFSEGGITDNAIKAAIIRNDMVSETANISASKLDIESLFEEINGSEHTIKSTKIYLDDEGQTLDVVFKEMTSDVTEMGETLTSQGTQISVIQGQITNKIWQEDINEAVDGIDTLKTQYSTLDQELDSISATVTSHETIIANKADASSVKEVSDQVAELELSLDGFKTNVSETYATVIELESTQQDIDNAQSDIDTLVSRMTNAETAIDQNAEAISLRATKEEVSEQLDGYYTKGETESLIQVESDSITSTVSATYATKQEVEDIEVGGRNLLLNTKTLQGDNITVYEISEETYNDYFVATCDIPAGESAITLLKFTGIYPEKLGETYTLSFYAKGNGFLSTTFIGKTGFVQISKTDGETSLYVTGYKQYKVTDEWNRYEVVWTLADTGDISIEKYVCFYVNAGYAVNVCGVKLEKGNKATDWTPAPEDVDGSIDNVQNMTDVAIEATNERVSTVETTIQQLADCISMLVTDENGASLMTQTEDGWTFCMGETNEAVNKVSNSLNDLQNEMGDTNATVEALQQSVNDLEETAEYVRIGVYEDEPCIELGESDSDFILMITNTRIMFRSGSSTPTYINTRGLVTENIEVNGEIIQGGYIMMNTSDGGWGLLWKGVED